MFEKVLPPTTTSEARSFVSWSYGYGCIRTMTMSHCQSKHRFLQSVLLARRMRKPSLQAKLSGFDWSAKVLASGGLRGDIAQQVLGRRDRLRLPQYPDKRNEADAPKGRAREVGLPKKEHLSTRTNMCKKRYKERDALNKISNIDPHIGASKTIVEARHGIG